MQTQTQTQTQSDSEQITILVATDALDRAFLVFMVATAARAMGLRVNIFFALFGLNLLRRGKNQKGYRPNAPSGGTALQKVDGGARPGLLEKMMGLMMPKGPSKLGLSKMNFGGMGAVMMKYLMRKKGVASLNQLMEMAVEQEVKFIVCSLTMDIMGFSPDDLLDLPNLEFGGVTSCVGLAAASKMFLVL